MKNRSEGDQRDLVAKFNVWFWLIFNGTKHKGHRENQRILNIAPF